MNEPDQQFRDRLREAVEKRGPAAGLELLSEIGFAIEKEPEAGVGMRMRYGTGTEGGFTSTFYAAAPERPTGWPAEVPFLPDVPGSLTLFDRPGHGFSIQWWRVADPAAAVQRILSECLAAGWRRTEESEPAAPSGLPGLETVVLQREDLKRLLCSATLKEVGFVQLLERHPGESCTISPAPPAGV